MANANPLQNAFEENRMENKIETKMKNKKTDEDRCAILHRLGIGSATFNHGLWPTSTT